MSADVVSLRKQLEATRRRELLLIRALVTIRDYSGEPSESHAWDVEMRRIAEDAIRSVQPGIVMFPRAEQSHAPAPAEQGHGRPEDGPGEDQDA